MLGTSPGYRHRLVPRAEDDAGAVLPLDGLSAARPAVRDGGAAEAGPLGTAPVRAVIAGHWPVSFYRQQGTPPPQAATSA